MNRQTIIIRGIEVIVSVCAGWILGAKDISQWLILAPTVALAGTIGWDFRQTKKTCHIALENQLSMMIGILGFEPADDVRCTVHIPTRSCKKYKQVCNYIPQGHSGGRRFPMDRGIVWKSHSARATLVENFATDQEFRRRMVDDYNYTSEQMRERTTDRRSYLCMPIMDNEKVAALFYLDARTVNAFPLSGALERQLELELAQGVVHATLLKS